MLFKALYTPNLWAALLLRTILEIKSGSVCRALKNAFESTDRRVQRAVPITICTNYVRLTRLHQYGIGLFSYMLCNEIYYIICYTVFKKFTYTGLFTIWHFYS